MSVRLRVRTKSGAATARVMPWKDSWVWVSEDLAFARELNLLFGPSTDVIGHSVTAGSAHASAAEDWYNAMGLTAVAYVDIGPRPSDYAI